MRIEFTEKQKLVLKEAGVTIPSKAEYTEDEIIEMDGKIKDHLLYAGFDKDYHINETGNTAEEIMGEFAVLLKAR